MYHFGVAGDNLHSWLLPHFYYLHAIIFANFNWRVGAYGTLHTNRWLKNILKFDRDITTRAPNRTPIINKKILVFLFRFLRSFAAS